MFEPVPDNRLAGEGELLGTQVEMGDGRWERVSKKREPPGFPGGLAFGYPSTMAKGQAMPLQGRLNRPNATAEVASERTAGAMNVASPRLAVHH